MAPGERGVGGGSGHRVRDALGLLEGGVEARLAAAHVVALPLRRDRLRVLAPALEEADSAEDLRGGGVGVRVRVRRYK